MALDHPELRVRVPIADHLPHLPACDLQSVLQVPGTRGSGWSSATLACHRATITATERTAPRLGSTPVLHSGGAGVTDRPPQPCLQGGALRAGILAPHVGLVTCGVPPTILRRPIRLVPGGPRMVEVVP